MPERHTQTMRPGLLARWPFLLASLVAVTVALLRTILGGRNDLPLLVEGLERPAMAAVIYINWHALNVTFATLAMALFAATLLPRAAAQAIGIIAAIIFGATALLFMYYVNQGTGSPFTFFPWIPLTLTTLLCAFAAWRA